MCADAAQIGLHSRSSLATAARTMRPVPLHVLDKGMIMTGAASPEFQDQLTDFLPTMRIWALSITRSLSAAEDLVQEVALKVLMACDSFVPGTNFPGWVHRIMVNQFITNVRRQREYNDL